MRLAFRDGMPVVMPDRPPCPGECTYPPLTGDIPCPICEYGAVPAPALPSPALIPPPFISTNENNARRDRWAHWGKVEGMVSRNGWSNIVRDTCERMDSMGDPEALRWANSLRSDMLLSKRSKYPPEKHHFQALADYARKRGWIADRNTKSYIRGVST